ncbi:MAG: hypothetical protein PWQ17_962 [Anaerophaga sp.]|uniref:DUF5320 domain-containing protein n=1 Tax=Anaerophaga thermohalophila TaxID=177400 RepID=UPI000237C432|nr:DUF5320 domain-containing protein [Anaerophaga thermohalophila]MDK2841457.1 hypothetical protein [Anaerophaga sp.]MDN5290717.1 hypothetical protein [Anaerophaga sp.]
MPAGDRTGPMGQGPRSGRGKGFCSGNTTPGYENDENRRRAGSNAGDATSGNGRGRGRGRGRGLGRR